MNSKSILASLIVVLGLALIFVFGGNTVVNQRKYTSFDSFLKTQSSENLETLSAKLENLETQVIKEGSGDRVVRTGDNIRVNYRGWLASTGTIFDQSFTRGDEGFEFTVGQGVIQGWSQGIVGMKQGEVRRLRIPSALGYGETGSEPAIPANSDLIFDVELIEIY